MGLSVKYLEIFIYFNVIHTHLHWTQYIIMKLIYQDRLMNLNYKDFPFHKAVICNCFRNCSIVWIRGPFRGIIPNNIHRTIEIVNNQYIMTDVTRFRVTVKFC